MYLVTGASGHLGQLVIASLLNERKVPPSAVIATTRDPAKLADLAAKGVTVRAADFNSADGLAEAFRGATRLLLISTDVLDRPGARLAQHRNAVAAAEKAAVSHIIYTSLPEPHSSAILFAPDHLGTEKAIADSSIPGWTVLRNNWYAENLFLGLPQALASGNWYSAAGSGKIAYVARADVAKAAAAALASDFTSCRTLTLTGKKAYSAQEVAALVSGAVGKPLGVVDVPEEALVSGLIAAGFPAPVAQVFASFDTETRRGGLAAVTGDVEALTGKAPQSLPDWIAGNARSFLQ